MSDKQFDLESIMHRVDFAKPSERYFSRGLELTRTASTHISMWNSAIGIAVCTGLLISLGINFTLINRQSDNFNNAETGLLASNSQIIGNGELQITDVAETDSIFRFLCLTNTTVVLNNTTELGELTGFAEWSLFEIPNNYEITVSLLPLRNWNAIGEFNDGTISLQLEAGDVIELRSVGMGPSGVSRGGPFPVYGKVENIAASRVATGASDQGNSTSDLETTSDNTPANIGNSGSLAIGKVLAGVDTTLSPITQKYFSALLRNNECG